MTREEAHGILSNGLVNAPSEHEWCMAFEMAIKALEQEPSISEDGTLTVNVEDGSKVSRVLVCGDNHFGGLYYPEQESCKVGHWISNAEDDLKISEYTCSNCKGLSDEDSDFCPKCGSYNGGAV